MIIQLSQKIPNDFDIVIGVPRSGLWVGDIIACKFGKPLSTPTNFVRGEIWMSKDYPTGGKKIKKILLVDDTVATGKRLKNIIKLLKNYDKNLDIKVAVLFVRKSCKNLVNYYYKEYKRILPFLEQDILKMPWKEDYYGKLLTDLDGVICENCPQEFDDDGKKYLKWLKNAKPYLIPVYTIDAIVTSRLEKYRKETKKWLKKHNVKYKKLIMLNLPNQEMRTFEAITKYKSDAIKKLKPFWFWESDEKEAKELHKLTGRQILCVETMKLYNK
jgi:hypoxanthine phosphoribosyltransferase